MKKISAATIWFLLLLAFSSLFPAWSAPPPGFREDVAAYNAKQYRQALTYFAQAGQAAPTDPMLHYYMGLTYQGLNQMTLARQQYEWVVACKSNPALSQQASSALQNLSRYQPSRAGSVSTAPATGTRSPSSSHSSGPVTPISGRLKILYFSTDWCGYCKKFDPTWEQVSSQMRGKVDFSKLDGDDESNKSLKEKYSVTGYPRLIFTVNTQKALLNHSGAPDTPQEFIALINQFVK